MSDGAPVLIVSASAGTGHVRAAQALETAFAAIGVATAHVDVLSLTPRVVRAAYGGGFELLAKRAPNVWREIYAWSDGPDGDAARWGPLVVRLLFREFRRLLLSQPWRRCVCTHFLPSQLAAGVAGGPAFSLVITDFSLHRYWAQPRVGEYFAPSAEVATQLQARMPGARIDATGIPIAGAWATGRAHAGLSALGAHTAHEAHTVHAAHTAHAALATAAMCPLRSRARRALGLDVDRPVVLLAGGGLGIGIEESVEASLEGAPDDAQVVVVCGSNEAAAARLRALGVPAGRLRVFGYLDGLEDALTAADVVITKPGGLTTSEALAAGTPLILTRAIPGHEEGNVRYLVGAGAALDARSGRDLRAALAAFFGNRHLRARLLDGGRTLARPDAAARIADLVAARTATRSVAA